MFEVIDKEKRAILGEFETRAEAEVFRAELLARDPSAGELLATSTGDQDEGSGN